MLKLKYFPLLLSLILILSGCGLKTESLISDPGKDYEVVYDVKGATFGVPKSFLKTATAITEISDNSDFDEEGVYLYKDGENKYLFFGMQQIVIAVEKGTTFHFTTTKDKKDALDHSSVMGIWMDPEKKQLPYEEDNTGKVYKLIATVDAQVVITKNLYGDFVGKLSSITTDQGEWSMFVGVPGSDYKKDVTDKQKKVIESIAKSLTSGEKEEETYYEVGTPSDISSSEAEEGTIEESVAENSKESSSETAEGESAEENTPSAAAPETAEAVETGESLDAAAGSVDSSEVENTTETQPPVETTELETVRPDESRPAEGTIQGMNMTNQKRHVTDMSGISDSSIYSFLTLGQKGSLQAFSEQSLKPEGLAITYDNIYMGDAAIKLIQDFCDSGSAGYQYTDPPVGTSWVVCEYTLDYLNLDDRPYVDIKALGADGKAIRHAGIEYKESERTYEITTHKKEDGNIISGMMVYFPLPANTNEFVLAAGQGASNPHYKGAFLLVKI